MTMTVIPLPGTGTCVGGTCTPPAQRYVATNGPITLLDNIILTQQTGLLTLALPNAVPADHWFVIKDFDGAASTFNIVLTTSGGDQIELEDGSGLGTTYTLDVDFQSVTVCCNGAGRYFII